MAQLITVQRPSFALGLAQGIDAMSGLAYNQARTALMKNQLQEHQQLKQAMGQYLQTGDIAPVMAANPQVAMQLQKNVMEMHKQKRAEDIATIDKTIDTVEKYLPALKGGDFKQYQALREQMKGIFGQGIDAVMPPGFKSEGDFRTWIDNFHNNYLNIKTAAQRAKDQAAMERKQLELNTLTPYQAGKLSEGQTRTGILQGRLDEEKKRTGIQQQRVDKTKEKPTKQVLFDQYQAALDRVNALTDPEEKSRQMKALAAEAVRRGVISKGAATFEEED